MSTDRLLTDHRDLAEYPAESALLGIAMLAPERAGEIVDAVDLDLWGLPVLRDLMADLAGQVHLHGPQAVGFVGFTMHAIDRHPITARAMSGMLDDVMPWQAIAPFAERIRKSARDRLVRESIDALHIAADDGEDIEPHVRRLQEAGAVGTSTVRPMLEVMTETVGELQAAWDGHGGRRWSTGLPDLDDALHGGVRAPQLVVVGGRPGMGKTALGLQMADACASAGGRVHVYSGEMARTELGARLMSLWSDAPAMEVQKPRDMRQATMDRIVNDIGTMRKRGYKMQVDDRGGKTWSEVAAGVMRSAFRFGGLDLVLVDYLQLLRVPKGHTEYSAYTEASKAAKAMAKELKCTVVLLAQLNRKADDRSSKDKRPKVTDLRATGQIEQDADIILMPYRPAVDDPRASPSTAEIGLLKYRQGPSGRWISHTWNGGLTRFEMLDLMGMHHAAK